MACGLDGVHEPFIHSAAQSARYKRSNFYGNNIVIEKNHYKEGYLVTNYTRKEDDSYTRDTVEFAAACNKVDQLAYLYPPAFEFYFNPDERTVAYFDGIEIAPDEEFVPIEIDFKQLIDFCSRITNTKLSNTFYEQLQLERAEFNEELTSLARRDEIGATLDVSIGEAGFSLAQDFTDHVPELLPNNNMRIWVEVIPTHNGGRRYVPPEFLLSIYQLDSDGSIIHEHLQQSGRRATIFDRKISQID